MARRVQTAPLNVSQAYDILGLDTLQPLAKLIAKDAPRRKSDLVPYLTRVMSRLEEVRRLYDSLDELGKAAVQEAMADPAGKLDPDRFEAKYGHLPDLGAYHSPTLVLLFIPVDAAIPDDLRQVLKDFVPEPRKVTIPSLEDLPESVPEELPSWRLRQGTQPQAMQLRRRFTAAAALREFPMVLRLVESAKLSVGEKTRKPSQATVETVAPLLMDGDFYQLEDRSQYQDDPGWDLAIRAFAWPCIVQAAGLTSSSAGRLSLAPAGRKALVQPAQHGIRTAWKKWIGTNLFDEFERVETIKGKQSARPSAASDRRCAVSNVLEGCPIDRWIAIDEFFRLLKASGEDFAVARNSWKLYIAEHRYGYFADRGGDEWNMLQGRFIMAMLFEYAATLGLIDVAYVAPQGARRDYRSHWGTDDYACLSRYDGLKFFRINRLGAWCLELTEDYQPEQIVARKTWKVLANYDVISTEHNPDPADALFLDRVADRTSDRVWHLDRDKVLTAVEDGVGIDTLREFLEEHSSEPVPANVQTFLADLRDRAGRLRDRGVARMIECADAETALMLLADAKLKTICLLAGERTLVFPAAQELTVRSRLRKLGYVMPPSK